MDSPRGLVFDGKTLYVMHPPNLTAYRDTTGDGVADVSEDIVTGLGFDLNFRGADHTTNGITLGIDGYIYIAVGDYGYRKATGKDGTTISHRGGGVVRVRPDGSGLELFAQGTRNIYDLAVDPMLHVFTRDNTNDGDGWDIRLHYLPAGAHMGYPMYYKYFSNEHMQSLADYGSGSGTGGLFVHDAGFPEGFGNTLYTSDWLINEVTRHPLTAKGASYEVKQEKFVTVPHPVDMAMDGQSNMFIASLYGGNFTYEGDTVGYVVRLSPNRTATPKAIDIAALTDVALRTQLGAANAEVSLQAQREILRRGARAGVVAGLNAMVIDRKRAPFARVAAMFTLTQLTGDKARAVITSVASDPAVRALALRALVDNKAQLAGLDQSVFVKALQDTSGPVQLAAMAALVRLNATNAAGAIVPLTASSDAAVAHIAVNALVSLKGSAVALKALNGAPPALRVGVLRALERMHDTGVVNALVHAATSSSKNGVDGFNDESAAIHSDVVAALARLYFREADWNGDWWGTRPNFVGPYFAPVPWEATTALRPILAAAANAQRADAATILAEYERNRIVPQGTRDVVMLVRGDQQRKALLALLVNVPELDVASANAVRGVYDQGGTAEKVAAANLLASQPSLLIASTSKAGYGLSAESNVNRPALDFAVLAARDATLPDSLRARIITLVSTLPASRMPGSSGLDAVTSLLASMNPAITPAGTPAPPIEAAWRRFVGDRRRQQEFDYFIDLSHGANANARTLAFAVLLQTVRGGRAPQAVNDKVQPVLTAAWASREAANDLVRAVNIMRLESAYTTQLGSVKARGNTPPT
ncbi:MAG: hypothetical protein ABI852_19330, partial [Gemmatimonadaceae bacterium]